MVYKATPHEMLYADIVGRQPDRARRELDNIKSIQQAVMQGRRSTLFDPAVGRDGLRLILAYDVDHLIAADKQEFSIVDLLQKMDIPYNIQEANNGLQRDFYFSINGKDRRVTEFRMDARDVKFKDAGIEGGKVDVLHIYLPMGAANPKYSGDIFEEDVNKENIDIIHPGFSPKLNAHNIGMINVEGYLCIEESHGGGHYKEIVPSVFFDMMGLREHHITNRNPYNVTTSFAPSEDSFSHQDGYIYQKVRTVDEDVVAKLEQLLSDTWTTGYQLDRVLNYGFYDEVVSVQEERQEFDHSDWDALETWTEAVKTSKLALMSQMNFADIMNETISPLLSGIDANLEDLVQMGVSSQQISEFRVDLNKRVMSRLKILQSYYKEFFEHYDSTISRLEKGDITSEQAGEELGFYRDEYDEIQNKQFPFAIKLLFENVGDEDLFLRYAKEFSEMSLDSILS